MNADYSILIRYPELKELLRILQDEGQLYRRPAEETILHDEDLIKLLGVSKRKIEYMKANKEIPYINPPMQRDYYILSDILDWLKSYRIESLTNSRRI